MPLESRNLDDRNFDQLVAQAWAAIQDKCPAWSDRSAGDPGTVLVELFAYLTDVLIYRLNRLPEKAYIELLRLMGVTIRPPAAASVLLRFSEVPVQAPVVNVMTEAEDEQTSDEDTEGASPDDSSAAEKDRGTEKSVPSSPTPPAPPSPPRPPIEIRQGTRVTLGRPGLAPGPIFVTARTVVLAPEQKFVDVEALHAEDVVGELVGLGTGRGLAVHLSRSPLVAPFGEETNLVVGVESTATEAGPERTRQFGGKLFRIWREVEHFADLGADGFAYIVDRSSGTITFGSGKLGQIPAAGREIRAWYRIGGGAGGNVGSDTLTSLKDPIPGVTVTNPGPAEGGRDAETPAEAQQRGPQELHSLRRAVTARDFQRVAESTGQIARAWAYTKAQIWRYAIPGTIEVLLVPSVVGRNPQEPVTAVKLMAARSDQALVRVGEELNKRRLLGTRVSVNWIACRTVRVKATIVAFDGEDQNDLAIRVRRRLDQYISPLDSPLRPGGWPFGQPLNVGRLYNALFDEPGTKDVQEIACFVEEAPQGRARSLVADWFQPNTWHALAGSSGDSAPFRTRDDGASWEQIAKPAGMGDDERLVLIRAHRLRAGVIAAITRIAGSPDRGVIYVSEDCGQTYCRVQPLAFAVNDVAWIIREGSLALILASERGLYELNVDASKRDAADALRLIPIEGLADDHLFYSVTVTFDATERPVEVAVAAKVTKAGAQTIGGVYISYSGGLPKSFINVSQGIMAGRDVRCLAAQKTGSRWYIWAGTYVSGAQEAEGLFRWEEAKQPWKQFKENWDNEAGTCYSIAVCGTRILAATYGKGVLWMDSATLDDLIWHAPGRDCGLPLQQGNLPVKAPLDTIWSVAADPRGETILAGSDFGVFRSQDQGISYQKVSNTEYRSSVPLPDSAIFCPGQHEIKVISQTS